MPIPISNSRMRLTQGQIFWREVGQGITLVFLHGSSHDSSQWLEVTRYLSSRYHCIVPDLLGFGVSEHPEVHYSIAWQVECLADYLEKLNVSQVYLIGHSLGGWIAASYALENSHQVCGLVLLAPEGVEVIGEKSHRLWSRLLIAEPPVLFWILRVLAPLAKVFGLKAKIQGLLRYRDSLLRSPAACRLLFQRRRSEINEELLQERLQWLKTPAIILQGETDNPQQIAQSKTYADLGVESNLKLVPQVGNNLPELLPELVAQEIDQFIHTHSSSHAR